MEYNSTHANVETRASLLHIHTYMIYISTHTQTCAQVVNSPQSHCDKKHTYCLCWNEHDCGLSIFVLLKEGSVMAESGHTENQ